MYFWLKWNRIKYSPSGIQRKRKNAKNQRTSTSPTNKRISVSDLLKILFSQKLTRTAVKLLKIVIVTADRAIMEPPFLTIRLKSNGNGSLKTSTAFSEM
jgi:hypothetical protein